MKHKILRAYIGLVRGEHFTASDIGETIDIDEDSYPAVQLNWTENIELKTLVCERKGWTEDQFDKSLIIPRPTFIQNLVYSAKLREMFGIENLILVGGFNKDGVFNLPRERGFYVPQMRNGQIESLKFYSQSALKPVKEKV